MVTMTDFNDESDLFLQHELIDATDHIIWHGKNLDQINSLRENDTKIEDKLNPIFFDFLQSININQDSITNVMLIGSASYTKNKKIEMIDNINYFLSPETKFVASVYGPMQCMLKGVCAQCLQWQVDPITGKRTKAVYACSWQHQPMELIDTHNLDQRQAQNKTQEILSNLWLDYILTKNNIDLAKQILDHQ